MGDPNEPAFAPDGGESAGDEAEPSSTAPTLDLSSTPAPQPAREPGLDASTNARSEAEAAAKAAVERARAEAAKKRAEQDRNRSAKSTTMVSAESPHLPGSPPSAAEATKAKPTAEDIVAALGVDPAALAASPTSTLVSGTPGRSREGKANPPEPTAVPEPAAAPAPEPAERAAAPAPEPAAAPAPAPAAAPAPAEPASAPPEVVAAAAALETKPVESVKFPAPPAKKVNVEPPEPAERAAREELVVSAAPTQPNATSAASGALPKVGLLLAVAAVGAALLLWRLLSAG